MTRNHLRGAGRLSPHPTRPPASLPARHPRCTSLFSAERPSPLSSMPSISHGRPRTNTKSPTSGDEFRTFFSQPGSYRNASYTEGGECWQFLVELRSQQPRSLDPLDKMLTALFAELERARGSLRCGARGIRRAPALPSHGHHRIERRLLELLRRCVRHGARLPLTRRGNGRATGLTIL